ncbi:hypothetical protein D6T63_15585 [Arthrobacter cheniae]|uniref:Uncharacterized protein n=1 Tax=Arthrobacter cheniae TaxID=1258888 RepID=A0A3A5M2I4_9MICC|nr:hypothetical protein [Arthrobacter cheniae]RJT76893.1 hypothetical protein D6T63_15585 [Arthrobacter cheniae]
MTNSPEVQALTNEHHCGLRSWAKGTYTTEAATELLIRAHEGRFARPGQPWIGMGSRWPYVDFEAIEENLGGLSGGERRFLLLVASLGDGGALVDLGDVIPGLDRDVLALVLAAIAHAGGSHEHSGFEFTEDGTPTSIVRLARLYDWPNGNII